MEHPFAHPCRRSWTIKLASRKLKTYQILKYDIEEFVTWVRKDNLEDITRTDLLRYKQYIMTSPEKPRTVKPHTVIKLRSERTACNKVGEVNQFLRWAMKVEPGKGCTNFAERGLEFILNQQEAVGLAAAIDGVILSRV